MLNVSLSYITPETLLNSKEGCGSLWLLPVGQKYNLALQLSLREG